MKRGNPSRGRAIDDRSSIVDLIWSLIPSAARRGTTPEAFAAHGKHRCRTILLSLWRPDGCCPRVAIDDICDAISREQSWAEWAMGSADCIEAERARLMRYVSRLNQVIGRSSWAPYVHIRHVGTRLELVTDKATIRELRARDSRPVRHQAAVTILARRHTGGLPVLSVGDPLKAQCSCTLSGYMSVFHINLNGLVEKVFPLEQERKFITAKRDTLVIPDALPTHHKPWTVKPTGRAQEGTESLLVVVTTQDVDVRASQIAAVVGSTKTRGLEVQTLSLDDIPEKGRAIGRAWYQYVHR